MTLSGTADVNVANTPTVSLASGTTVRTSADTVLIFDQVVHVVGTITPIVGPVDVNSYKTFRVVVFREPSSASQFLNVTVEYYVVNPNNEAQEASGDRFDTWGPGATGTKVYDAIFAKMVFFLTADFFNPDQTVRLQVYGRN